MDQFVTVTLENMFTEPIIIGDASIHFALTEVSKRPIVEMQKLFDARITPHEPLPLTLSPQEVFSFVISVHSCPLGSVEEVGTNRRHVHPSLLLTWRPLVTPMYLVSQFSVPFPTPQAEQLLLTVSVPEMPLPLNTVFDLNIALTNLASYPRSLGVELPIPDIKSLWSSGVSNIALTASPLTVGTSASKLTPTSDETLTQALIAARSREISILCIEKHIHLGRAEPKGELTAKVKCIAAQTGIFALEGIKVFDKHNRDDVRIYVTDSPIELSVAAHEDRAAGHFALEHSIDQQLLKTSAPQSLDSSINDQPFGTLAFSSPDPYGDAKVELDFP